MGEYSLLKIAILIEMAILTYGIDYYTSKYGAERHSIFLHVAIVGAVCFWVGTTVGGENAIHLLHTSRTP
jgi:hypothetical protein